MSYNIVSQEVGISRVRLSYKDGDMVQVIPINETFLSNTFIADCKNKKWIFSVNHATADGVYLNTDCSFSNSFDVDKNGKIQNRWYISTSTNVSVTLTKIQRYQFDIDDGVF